MNWRISSPSARSGVAVRLSRSVRRSILLAALTPLAAVGLPSAATGQGPGDGVPVVTLDEARRRAASVDPDAIAARGNVDVAIWERRAARADLLTPSVTAALGYTHFSDPFFNFGTGSISPNATSATLQASYTLLGAGKLGTLRSSSASIESAEARETAIGFRTALAVDAAYFAVIADRDLRRVAAERLRRAEEQFGVARARVLAGDAIASDSLQLLLEVTRARVALLSGDSAVVVSRLRLGRQIGLSGPADPASTDTSVPPALPMSQDEMAAEVRARGPDLEAARAAERRASAELGVEREAYLPEVTLGLTTGAYDAELFPSALKRTQVGFTVALPIWNGGARELAVARARVQRDVARAERENLERAARELVAEAWHAYGTSRAGVDLASVGVAVATENYRVQRARYQEGATTILELLEAQVALSEADASLVRARYATRLALARIEALLGRRIFETPRNDH